MLLIYTIMIMELLKRYKIRRINGRNNNRSDSFSLGFNSSNIRWRQIFKRMFGKQHSKWNETNKKGPLRSSVRSQTKIIRLRENNWWIVVQDLKTKEINNENNCKRRVLKEEKAVYTVLVLFERWGLFFDLLHETATIMMAMITTTTTTAITMIIIMLELSRNENLR